MPAACQGMDWIKRKIHHISGKVLYKYHLIGKVKQMDLQWCLLTRLLIWDLDGILEAALCQHLESAQKSNSSVICIINILGQMYARCITCRAQAHIGAWCPFFFDSFHSFRQLQLNRKKAPEYNLKRKRHITKIYDITNVQYNLCYMICYTSIYITCWIYTLHANSIWYDKIFYSCYITCYFFL